MKTKENVSDEDINEMLEEYKKLYGKKCDGDGMDPGIVYKGKLIFTFILNLINIFYLTWTFLSFSDFIDMLQH